MRRAWVFALARRCQSSDTPFCCHHQGHYPKIMIGIMNIKYGRLATVAGQIETEGTQRSKGRASIPLIAALSYSLLSRRSLRRLPRRRPSDIIAPQNNPAHARRRLAGRHLHDRHARSAPSTPRISSSKKPPATPRSASPSSSSNTPKARCSNEKPGRRTRQSPGRPPGRAERQPPGDAAVRRHRRTRADCAASAPLSRGRDQRRHRSRSAGVVTPPAEPLTKVPVYNLVPEDGEPALFGLELAGNNVYLKADVAWEATTTRDSRSTFPKPPIPGARSPDQPPGLQRALRRRHLHHHPDHLPRPRTGRLRGHLLDLPARRLARRTGIARATRSRRAPSRRSSRRCRQAKNRSTARASPTNPSLEVDPGEAADRLALGGASPTSTSRTSPAAANAESSQTRRAEVTLPAGMGINPSAANGLVACSDAQFGKGTRNPVACPPASKIGTVAIETPPLPARLADRRRLRRPAEEPRPRLRRRVPDLRRRRVGALRDLRPADRQRQRRPADRPADHRLRRRQARPPPLPGLPQVPFTSFKLDFNDGPRAPLTSPPTCGPHTTTTSLTPWSGNPPATPTGDFTLDRRPGRRRLRRDAGRAPLRARASKPPPTTRRAAPSARSGSTSPAPTASRS